MIIKNLGGIEYVPRSVRSGRSHDMMLSYDVEITSCSPKSRHLGSSIENCDCPGGFDCDRVTLLKEKRSGLDSFYHFLSLKSN